MKAAILDQLGNIPVYGDIAQPIPANEDQLVIKMEAATIKQLDKLKVSGKHYTSFPSFPTTVGVDGVGRLDNGQRVYAMGLTGMIAEYALVDKASCVPVPEKLPSALAAVLPNALLGSDAALVCRAKIQKGDVVLINGATGVSGRMAVQAAKYRGASRIIVTGRNAQSLAYLKQLGADVCISLLDDDTAIMQQLMQVQQQTPIDHVLDYLWGKPTELLLSVLAKQCEKPINIITIGQMASAEINLPSSILRSKPISLIGSGFGSISAQLMHDYHQNELPKLFALAAEGGLLADYEVHPLEQVEQAWQAKTAPGSRIVISI
ncbi:MAG: zinc-binding dehydrogenase [Firmicutes bacterium]|nr:zinc-binding dehydrogenase [Bacillota bacterium]